MRLQYQKRIISQLIYCDQPQTVLQSPAQQLLLICIPKFVRELTRALTARINSNTKRRRKVTVLHQVLIGPNFCFGAKTDNSLGRPLS